MMLTSNIKKEEVIEEVRCVDLNAINSEIMPGIYFLYETGGPHYFSQCKNEVEPIYRENIWPFIYRVQNNPGNKLKSGILLGSISATKTGYPIHKLYSKDDTRTKRMYRSDKEKIFFHPRELERLLHRLVAQAFIPNDDPENKTQVDHINGNRVDFRVDNLRWVTPIENAKGCLGYRKEGHADKVYERISKQSWFNGGGTNNILSPKDKYFKQLKLKI